MFSWRPVWGSDTWLEKSLQISTRVGKGEEIPWAKNYSSQKREVTWRLRGSSIWPVRGCLSRSHGPQKNYVYMDLRVIFHLEKIKSSSTYWIFVKLNLLENCYDLNIKHNANCVMKEHWIRSQRIWVSSLWFKSSRWENDKVQGSTNERVNKSRRWFLIQTAMDEEKNSLL